MMLSVKLLREVLREVKYVPHHAYKVMQGRQRNGVYPHQNTPLDHTENNIYVGLNLKK